MYLFILEDGEAIQKLSFDKEDIKMFEDGYIQIFKIIDDKYFQAIESNELTDSIEWEEVEFVENKEIDNNQREV